MTVSSAPTGIVTAPSSAGPITPKPEPESDGGSGTSPSAPGWPVLPGVSVTAAVEHTFRGRIVGEPDGATCPQDRATLKFEHVRGGQVKLSFGKTSTAHVQLTCTATGKAIAGAQLDVATRVGAKPAVAADVSTDDAGHATLRLAKGAGRAITVGYRMYADDPIARATATLRVLVNGRVALKANRRHLRNGQAVTLRGSLRGGEVPARGVTLAVQWKDGYRWRPFAQIKTNRKGTFQYAYRFTRTSGSITYALRVQVTKGQVNYPYMATASSAGEGHRCASEHLAPWLVALVSVALSLVLASSAPAEEVFLSQAAAANATDSTWIPAPAQRAAVCIVDTGNDPNPDTSTSSPVYRSTANPAPTTSPDHHGTLMSMIAAAPYNGFGMVGAAPSINVVSVRASRDGVTFGATDLAARSSSTSRIAIPTTSR